jgi:hypothetical protein
MTLLVLHRYDYNDDNINMHLKLGEDKLYETRPIPVATAANLQRSSSSGANKLKLVNL